MWSVFSLTTDLCQQQHVISCLVVNVNDTPNYNIKKIPTLLDFSSLSGSVCYTVSPTWECLELSACVIESSVVLPCLKLSFIWHTKVKAKKSDWSVKTYIKADHNTITPFDVKVMSKYKVLSKREHGMIKISYGLENLGSCLFCWRFSFISGWSDFYLTNGHSKETHHRFCWDDSGC